MPKFTHRKQHKPPSEVDRARTVDWPTATGSAVHPKSDTPNGPKRDLQIRQGLSVQEDPPTEEEYQELEKLDWFIANTEIGKERTSTTYRFTETGTDVIVIPTLNADVEAGPVKELNLWKGRILQIRRAGRDQIWVKLAWFYSPHDFALLKVKGFDIRNCGTHELIFSPQHTDIVDGYTLNGVLEKIGYFDENNYDQLPINDGVYYYRYKYLEEKKRLQCKPAESTCICKKVYKGPGDADTEMRFCAREGCDRWFHIKCLERRGSSKVEFDDVRSLKTRLEGNFGQRHRDRLHGSLPEDMERLPEGRPSERRVAWEKACDIYNLHTIARLPIVRGGAYSVVGNAGPVLRARYLMDLALRERVVVTEEDAEAFISEGREWNDVITSISKECALALNHPKTRDGKYFAYKCPYCQLPI